MKNILLTAALSVATFFGVLTSFDNRDEKIYDLTLPPVEIRANPIPEKTLEMTLPGVTICAIRYKLATEIRTYKA